MTISSKAARDSIEKALAHLPGTVSERALKQMADDGLIHEDAVHAAADPVLSRRYVMTFAQAAAEHPEARARLNRAKAMAARAGYQIQDDKKISVFELDQAIRDKDLDERFRLKAELASLHLLD